MKSSSTVNWLLEENQPSIRYLTLTELLGESQRDPEVVSARKAITDRGWVQEILARQTPGGWWGAEESLYRPLYTATNWMLLILSDLGLTNKEPRIAKACELWMRRFAKKDGGFNTDGAKKGHLCIVGNTARALIQFGYADHPKVQSALNWLVKEQKENGGWHCWSLKGINGVLDGWEGMSAFSVYPKQKWTRSIKQAVERGAEFFLERELYKQGADYPPWHRFHYPVHYYYDILVGLDFITALGYRDDSRLAHAIELLKKKRRPDGRWNLDAIHPELQASLAEWLRRHPNRAPIPFALEKAGSPSKMVTFKALRILSRLGETI